MKAHPLILLALLAGPAAAASPADFAWQAEVCLEAAERDELAAVTLTPAVYAQSRTDLGDLALFDDAGRAVPFKIESVTASDREVNRQERTLTLRQVEELPGNVLRLTLADPNTNGLPLLRGLRLETPLRDFERRVRVEGSVDGTSWRLLATNAPIFDVSRYAAFAHHEIALAPAAGCRLVRLTCEAVEQRPRASTQLTEVDDGDARRLQTTRQTTVDARPFQVTRLVGWAEVPRTAAVLVPYAVAWRTNLVVSRAGPRRLLGNVAGARLPLRRLVLRVTGTDVSQPFRLLGARAPAAALPLDAEPERLLAEGRLVRFAFRDFLRESLTIDFADGRWDDYRLELPEPAADFAIAGIEAWGECHRLFFIARPGQHYRLLCGGDSAAGAAGNHAADAVQVLRQQGFAPVAATITALTRNSDARPRHGVAAWQGRWIFPTGVALAVAALAWALVHASRKVSLD